jgi:hypothetical protein
MGWGQEGADWTKQSLIINQPHPYLEEIRLAVLERWYCGHFDDTDTPPSILTTPVPSYDPMTTTFKDWFGDFYNAVRTALSPHYWQSSSPTWDSSSSYTGPGDITIPSVSDWHFKTTYRLVMYLYDIINNYCRVLAFHPWHNDYGGVPSPCKSQDISATDPDSEQTWSEALSNYNSASWSAESEGSLQPPDWYGFRYSEDYYYISHVRTAPGIEIKQSNVPSFSADFIFKVYAAGNAEDFDPYDAENIHSINYWYNYKNQLSSDGSTGKHYGDYLFASKENPAQPGEDGERKGCRGLFTLEYKPVYYMKFNLDFAA